MSEKHVVSDSKMESFIEWLLIHEDDIEYGYNDYGRLRLIFWEIIGRNAGEDE